MKIETLSDILSKVSRNKSKCILYILISILFIIVFNYSNDIAVKLLKEPNEQLLYKVNDIPCIGGNITYSYESFRYDEFRIKNNVNINFWSYVDSEKDNVNRKATIYFKSDKNTYACNAIMTRRIDIYRLNREFVRGKSEKYGFVVNFSPLVMKDGEYQLGIYTEENSEERAFVWTPYTFIKEGNSFLEIKHNKQIDSKMFSELKTNKGLNVKVNTISTAKYKDYLYIDGYAFKESYDSNESKIFVELVPSIGNPVIIDTVKMNVNNIGTTYDHTLNVLPQGFDNEKYLDSGFATKIPLTILNEDTYEINVIAEINVQIYTGKTDEKYVNRVGVNTRADGMEMDINKDVSYYIEDINVRDDIINVSGWIIENYLNSANQQVYIIFRNENGNIQTFKASSNVREDIAKWKGDNYLSSGFKLSIPTEYLVESKYTVLASVKSGNKLDTAAKPYIEEEKEYLNRTNIGKRVDGLNINKNDKVQYYIETLGNVGNMISATGWIFKDGTPSIDHNIYIKLENQDGKAFVYKAAINERNDIAVWKGKEYLYSGFNVSIPNTTLPEGEYKVTALIETDQVEVAVKPYIEEVKKYIKK